MTFEEFYKKPLDPVKKRGPHHLKLGRGLNTDRNKLNIVAKMHELDPTEHPLLRKLKGLTSGREFIHNVADAQQIAGRFGIDLSAVKAGEPKILGNKTGIKIHFDVPRNVFVLTKHGRK
jgi:hypothetical protein